MQQRSGRLRVTMTNAHGRPESEQAGKASAVRTAVSLVGHGRRTWNRVRRSSQPETGARCSTGRGLVVLIRHADIVEKPCG